MRQAWSVETLVVLQVCIDLSTERDGFYFEGHLRCRYAAT